MLFFILHKHVIQNNVHYNGAVKMSTILFHLLEIKDLKKNT